MANFYGRPMVLDTVWTAGTIPAALKPPTGPADTTNTRNNAVAATLIIWHGSTAAGSVSIQDINGNVLAQQTIPTSSLQIGQDVIVYSNSRNPLKLKQGGWVLATLGSGTLVIYY